MLIFYALLILSLSARALSYDVPAKNVSHQGEITEEQKNTIEKRLAAQILGVLDHYKQDNPIGLPGMVIPDPMFVPGMKKNLPMATLNMQNVWAHGLSNFQLAHIKADLDCMKVNARIELKETVVRGLYTLSTIFSRATGNFTVSLKRVVAHGTANMIVDPSGHLVADNIQMNITFGSMAMDFQNLGFLGSLFQSIINSAPNLVFDAMTPLMLQEAKTKMREEIDKNVEKVIGKRLLPNSITPLDMAIAEARKKLRTMGYDPYKLPSYNRTLGVFTLELSNCWLRGISNIYRVGNISVGMENKNIQVIVQAATQEIAGESDWEVNLGFMSRVGHVEFTVDNVLMMLDLSQPVDIKLPPQINDLELELGNIKFRGDGAGIIDYIAEFGINVVPNLLRYEVMDALKQSIKIRLQEKLNQLDVQDLLENNMDKFAELSKNIIVESI